MHLFNKAYRRAFLSDLEFSLPTFFPLRFFSFLFHFLGRGSGLSRGLATVALKKTALRAGNEFLQKEWIFSFIFQTLVIAVALGQWAKVDVNILLFCSSNQLSAVACMRCFSFGTSPGGYDVVAPCPRNTQLRARNVSLQRLDCASDETEYHLDPSKRTEEGFPALSNGGSVAKGEGRRATLARPHTDPTGARRD